MKYVLPPIFVLLIIGCRATSHEAYRSTASLPRQTESVQSRITAIPGQRNDALEVYAAEDITPLDSLTYIMIAPIDPIEGIQLWNGVSLTDSEANKFIRVLDGVTNTNPPDAARFESRVLLPVQPINSVFQGNGATSIVTSSIRQEAWVSAVEFVFNRPGATITLRTDSWSSYFNFSGNDDIRAFRDRLQQALMKNEATRH